LATPPCLLLHALCSFLLGVFPPLSVRVLSCLYTFVPLSFFPHPLFCCLSIPALLFSSQPRAVTRLSQEPNRMTLSTSFTFLALLFCFPPSQPSTLRRFFSCPFSPPPPVPQTYESRVDLFQSFGFQMVIGFPFLPVYHVPASPLKMLPGSVPPIVSPFSPLFAFFYCFSTSIFVFRPIGPELFSFSALPVSPLFLSPHPFFSPVCFPPGAHRSPFMSRCTFFSLSSLISLFDLPWPNIGLGFKCGGFWFVFGVIIHLLRCVRLPDPDIPPPPLGFSPPPLYLKETAGHSSSPTQFPPPSYFSPSFLLSPHIPPLYLFRQALNN